MKQRAQQARSWLPLMLGVGALLGCEKPALREHLGPPSGSVGPVGPGGGGGQSDASADPGFEPTPVADAGPATRDAGGDAGNVVGEPRCGQVATDQPFSKAALLESFASCITLQYCEFEALAETFSESAAAYAEEPSEETLKATKNAWYFAMQRWQLAELFSVGPAASTMEPGGQSLRNEIYAFPAGSRCKIEEQIGSESYAPATFDKMPFYARGLATAEYLLFFGANTNSCSVYSSLNYPAPGSWGALSAEQLAARKRTYYRAVARDVHVHAKMLLDSWLPEAGNFSQQLIKAGHGSKVFTSEQSALNAVSNALFYMEVLKDAKVGGPAGLMECKTNCAGSAESLYARIGADNARANLEGFRLLFQGCGPDHEGLGFDDWLRAVNMGALADDMLAALDGAEAALLDFDLDKQLIEDPSKVVPVYAAIKALTDLFKTELMAALNLERPMALETDND